MKNLLMSFLAITFVLYGGVLCIADDFGSESLQCSMGTISIGNPKAEVLSLCGPPTSKSTQPDGTETWMYNFGSTDYIYNLNFIGDQLNTIMQGGRGY